MHGRRGRRLYGETIGLARNDRTQEASPDYSFENETILLPYPRARAEEYRLGTVFVWIRLDGSNFIRGRLRRIYSTVYFL